MEDGAIQALMAGPLAPCISPITLQETSFEMPDKDAYLRHSGGRRLCQQGAIPADDVAASQIQLALLCCNRR